ncbi:MAG: ABC-2 family transporter protein [bacterium]|nr:ABC-2 family transporter protein [bacterium]
MKKYWTIISIYWQRALTYRFTVLSYRVGEAGETLVLILMWIAIYGGDRTMISGFTVREMITYILVGNFFNAMIRNFLSMVIEKDIKDGRLSMFIVKPMSYFSYILSQEIGRISFSTISSVLTSGFVILCFANTFIWKFDGVYFLVISIMVILAFITELLLSYLVGLIAFWTDEVGGLYATIDRIKKFFSGGYFPLNLLPVVFVNISFALPFAYSFFIPAQLYLKKFDVTVGLKGLLVQCCWILILYGIIKIVWNRGLKKYEGVGM